MLHYSNMPLDRGSNFRNDPAWLKAHMSAQSKWVLVKNNQTLFIKDTPKVSYLSYQQVAHLDLTNAIFVGLNNAKDGVFALDVSKLDTSILDPLIDGAQFVDIRQYGPQVTIKYASIAALARGLCYWHATHSFCGRCGSKNHLVEAGHSRVCENENCKHPTFPQAGSRTSPSDAGKLYAAPPSAEITVMRHFCPAQRIGYKTNFIRNLLFSHHSAHTHQ